jgi:CHAT domain-containing protein
MSREQAAKALSMVMKSVQAFDARDLNMAAAAIAMAEELNEGGAAALGGALAEAAQAIRADDRKALLRAVAKAAAFVDAAPETDAAWAQPPVAPEVTAKTARPAEARPVAGSVVERSAPAVQVAAEHVAPVAVQILGGIDPVPATAAPEADAPRTPVPVPVLANLPPDPASRALLLLGEALHALGRGDEPAALDALAHALMSSAAGPEAEDLAAGEAFSRLGGSLAESRRWAPAREAMTRGLEIKMRVLGKSHRRIAADLTALSSLAEQLGDYDEARLLAERGLTIRRLQSNGDPKDLADSLVQYGKAALGLEDYATASDCLREALAIGRDVRAPDLWMADGFDLLGLVVARLEDGQAARALHEQAFGLRRTLLPADHPDIGRSLLHVGGFLLAAGQYEEAATHFRGALEIFEAHAPAEAACAALCLEHLAVLEVRRQNLEPGRKLLVSAVETLRAAFGPEQLQVMKFETELAFLTLFTGDLAGAAALGYAVLWRAKAAHHATLRRDLWFLLSQLAGARGEADAAILFGKLAANAVRFQPGGVTTLETPLQRLFAARHGDVFRHLAGLLVRAGRLPEASDVLAMLKEDELFDMLRRDPARDPRDTQLALNPAEAAWVVEGDDIQRALADAAREEIRPGEVKRRREEAERRFEPWLKSAQARCAAAAAAQQHPGLAALGARVGQLHMVSTPSCLHLLFTTTEFQIAREVAVSAGTLRRLALAFRQAVQDQAADAAALGAELYQYLIAPVAEIYRDLGVKTLLVGAADWLRYVPFAALHDGTKYLAETTATVLLTEAWRVESPVWPEKMTIAAMGDAGVAAELRGLVRSGQAELATDALFNATSLSEALAARQVVHVASRTVLDAAVPAASTMALGDGSALLVSALAQMPFYFREVVLMSLTACETASGEAAGDGSEVEGLGALLRWRKTGAVLASHWRPPAAPVAALVAAFYEPRKGRRLASGALNAAQRAMLAGEFNHPYFWAGYFVMGGIE